VQVQHQHALAVAHSSRLLDAAALTLGVEALQRATLAAARHHLIHLGGGGRWCERRGVGEMGVGGWVWVVGSGYLGRQQPAAAGEQAPAVGSANKTNAAVVPHGRTPVHEVVLCGFIRASILLMVCASANMHSKHMCVLASMLWVHACMCVGRGYARCRTASICCGCGGIIPCQPLVCRPSTCPAGPCCPAAACWVACGHR